MYIVVAGEDELAIRVTEALMGQHDVVLIVSTPTLASRVERLDIQVVHGNANSGATLRQARIEKADFFIAASASDERNIVNCVAAEHAGAARSICIIHGVSDPQVMALDDQSLSEAVGIDVVVRPAEQLINEILHIVTVPGALNAKTLLDGRFEVVKALVEEGASISVGDLGKQKMPRGMRIVMVERNGRLFIPEMSTQLETGDRVTAIGVKRRLARYIQRIFRSSNQNEKRRAIVCGGGSVGVGVANGLREAGWSVKIIEQDRRRCEELSQLCSSLVLHGDASDLDLLQEEHIESVSALIAVTNNDEKNLLISLIAKHLGVPRIITRTDRSVNERIFEKVGIDVVLSARGAAVRTIVSEIINADRIHVAELDHGDVEILDLELPPTFTRCRATELFPIPIAALGGVMRNRRARVPRDHDTIEPGDHVLVVCLARHEDAVRSYLTENRPLPATVE
jgi:trk system potassium uptake protein TrkA